MSGSLGGGSGSGSTGPNGGAGYGGTSLPPGWPETVTFLYYNWQDPGAAGAFALALQDPNFSIVSGITVVVEPDAVQSGIVPQLQFCFANLPPGKNYYFSVHMPLSSLSQPTYPFLTRAMMVQYSNRLPVLMQVPILSASNGPLVSAWVVQRFQDLQAIFTAAGSQFILQGFGCALTSLIYFDAEFTIPRDISEDAAEAVQNWAAYGVNVTDTTQVIANHMAAVAQGPGAGKFLTCMYLTPNNSFIGQVQDGAASYTGLQIAITNALYSIGVIYPVFDQSLSFNNQDADERPTIAAAANYSGFYACQLTGKAKLPDSINYALSRSAIWIETNGVHVDPLVASGWNGSEYVIGSPPEPIVFVTC